MKHAPVQAAARFLAILAVVLQVLLPGTLAVAQSQDIDLSRYLCAPDDQMSAQARAMAERLAGVLDDEAPDHLIPDGHCPLCTLVQAAVLPDPVLVAAPVRFISETGFVRYVPAFVHKAQGPPLGSRGPPAHR
ncbi:MAG: DUF2946 domain-containing protein [Hyphomonas sp.]|uniref:DUF2946 family protein n=1 Tax=Hyphomonas sp. TaxID=87 RepID=UPI0017E889E8|nr:DUF2946 family protein [Hyphomonas sp.]MBU3922060.1 DUF2946 family protein [Alphaproteobacteria bacterium]MBA3067388.1 DUF2946 domain-containing protein [Hyphomonas sp.]MBU4061061.1 DUF2946 family protein [Alphaproteobacteria bacterium]MBU4165917.1 DUF2946 family protein [Alphaproteobacteria bacterium]MBU4568928.1 DUF2946 family protein [Alphaproteobacteria bacterium]